MTDNLALWNAVEKTPPSQTKAITGKSYQGTSPKPHYLVHKATETFGPCGIGWGFTIEDERIEEGAGGERMSIARVKVWFKWEGERGEVEHIGGTQFSGARSSGKPFTDEDAPKKSVTDALIKALSMIGFAGDIFMGRFDDSKYVAELNREFAGEPAPAPVKNPTVNVHPEGPDWWGAEGFGMSASQAKKEGWGEKLDDWLGFIPSIPTAAAWKDWCNENAADIKRLPKGWRVMLREAAEERGVELGAIQSTTLKAA